MSEIDFDVYYDCSTFDKYLPAAHSPYTLNLDHPHDYVVACELLRISAEYRLCSFFDVSYSSNGQTTQLNLEYSAAKRSIVAGKTPWMVPIEGVLDIACTFTPNIPKEAQIIIREALPWVTDFIKSGITPRETSSLLQVRNTLEDCRIA